MRGCFPCRVRKAMGDSCNKCGGKKYRIDGKGEFARAVVCGCAGDCGDCGGRGFLIEKKDGYKSKVSCRSCSDMRDNVKKYNRAQIPAVMAGARVKGGSVTNNYIAAAQYVEGFITHYPERQGFVLCGSAGCGKSDLAALVVAELTLKQGVGCLFQDFGDLILRLKDRSAGTSELVVLEPLFKIPLLVIDGVGSGGREITDWERNVLESIVSKRHGARAKTVITTKYGESEFKTHVGDRSFSRISAMCEFLGMD